MSELNLVDQEARSIRLMRVAGAAGVAGGLALGEAIHYMTGSDVVTRLLVDGGLATAAATICSVSIGLFTETHQQV